MKALGQLENKKLKFIQINILSFQLVLQWVFLKLGISKKILQKIFGQGNFLLDIIMKTHVLLSLFTSISHSK